MTKILRTTSLTSFEIGLTASTTQTQGQQPLVGDNCIITTVANDNDVVTLTSVSLGLVHRIFNRGANVLQIFPFSGDDLGKGVNTSMTLNPTDSITFMGIDEINWEIISILDISCKVTKSADQAITTGAPDQAITWNLEDYDTDGMHDNSTNNTRITIKTAGKYHVSGQGLWESSSVGQRDLVITVNGTTVGKTRYAALDNAQHQINFVGDLVVNDYVEFKVRHDVGSDLDFRSGISYFEAHKIN